ncbi:MAG: hypothetical protein ACLVJ6_05660 [Merdibacter sp.]
MNDILYVVLPFVISLVLTPLVKRIAYRLDAFAQVNERTVHSGRSCGSAVWRSMWRSSFPWRSS